MGISQMVATVTKNKAASCRVNAVPTYAWSASSVTMVENCAEAENQVDMD